MNFIKKLFGSGGGGGGSETSSSASVDRLEQLGIDEKDLVYRSRSSTSVNRQSGTVAVLQTFNSRSQQTGYTVREVKMSSSKHIVQVLPGLFLGENKTQINSSYYSITSYPCRTQQSRPQWSVGYIGTRTAEHTGCNCIWDIYR